MIERERLNELKKDNAVIYAVVPTFSGNYHYVKEIHLYPSMFIMHEINRDDDKLFLYDSYAEGYDDYIACIEDLFENEDDAKFEANFGRIIRRQKLRMPTWEEIWKDLEDKTGEFVIVDNYNLYMEFDLEPLLTSGGKIRVLMNDGHYGDFTVNKEGYLQACEKAKELFLEG